MRFLFQALILTSSLTSVIFASEQLKTKTEVENFVSFNPWSSIWVDIANANPNSFLSQELSYGYILSSDRYLELGLIYGQGDEENVNSSTYTDAYYSETREFNKTNSKGISATYFLKTRSTAKTHVAVGPRVAYSEIEAKTRLVTESTTTDTSTTSSSWYSYERKDRVAVVSVVGQFEYHVDDYLSFGLRYSLNHRKTLSFQKRTSGSTYAEVFNTPGSDTADDLTFTSFDGAHITIYF